jgi:hypothetical protein
MGVLQMAIYRINLLNSTRFSKLQIINSLSTIILEMLDVQKAYTLLKMRTEGKPVDSKERLEVAQIQGDLKILYAKVWDIMSYLIDPKIRFAEEEIESHVESLSVQEVSRAIFSSFRGGGVTVQGALKNIIESAIREKNRISRSEEVAGLEEEDEEAAPPPDRANTEEWSGDES